MYSFIGVAFTLTMVIAVIWDYAANSVIADVMKNLSYGNLASTFVALLIEIGNTKDKNEKANNVYDAVYIDLKCNILWYLTTWARICKTISKDYDYTKEKYPWLEWYELTKSNFKDNDYNRQKELMFFLKEQLFSCLENVENAINVINSQYYLLCINNLYDEELKNLLDDYAFEFHAAKLFLENNFEVEEFWDYFDAINKDFKQYISNWVDISYYNYYRFKPYEYLSNSNEIMNAIIRSELDS